MRQVKYSLFVFMLLALVIAGIIGYGNTENLKSVESFHTTIGSLTFSGDSSGFSEQGKLLSTALTLASVAVIVWAFVNFHHTGTASDQATDFFKFIPQDEGLVLKEIKIAKKSHLAGLTKIKILQKTGTVVFAVKKGNSYGLNIAFNKKLTAGSKALFLGTSSQLKEVEREAK